VYKSELENRVAYLLGEEWEYEPEQYFYQIESWYTPDFVHGDILVEVKGFFRPGDTKKYKAVKQWLPEEKELVFLLSNPGKKVRKGAKMTMAEWCNKEGFKWFALTEIEALKDYANK